MSEPREFAGAYRGRRVLVTGHTGFKGSWLSAWLLHLGARVVGFSLEPPTAPSHFDALGLAGRLDDRRGDVRDLEALGRVFEETRPEVVLHLAAQAIVRASFGDPKRTFDTNLGGTVNVLECLRRTEGVRAAVFVTSDKCYLNREWPWAYREDDILGGEDPYGASKACADIAARSYAASFLAGRTRLATARAGNVIGGGDWAPDRIVPDAVRAWSEGRPLILRSPRATRPWEHVLEPLGGYLALGQALLATDRFHGEAFNFGPPSGQVQTVQDVIRGLAGHWPGALWRSEEPEGAPKENTLLMLSCDKALHLLDWRATLSFEETIQFTAEWYQAFERRDADPWAVTAAQLDAYVSRARERGLAWAA